MEGNGLLSLRQINNIDQSIDRFLWIEAKTCDFGDRREHLLTITGAGGGDDEVSMAGVDLDVLWRRTWSRRDGRI